MSYIRVIPRDLFNEGNLLKCYGQVIIALEKWPGIVPFETDNVASFDIVQREDDGAIFIENLPLTIGFHQYRLTRPLNSRRSFPLYAERIDDTDFEPVEVFDESGQLTADMLRLIGHPNE